MSFCRLSRWTSVSPFSRKLRTSLFLRNTEHHVHRKTYLTTDLSKLGRRNLTSNVETRKCRRPCHEPFLLGSNTLWRRRIIDLHRGDSTLECSHPSAYFSSSSTEDDNQELREGPANILLSVQKHGSSTAKTHPLI